MRSSEARRLNWIRFTTLLSVLFFTDAAIYPHLARGNSIRSQRPLGFHWGVLSDPFPTIAGMNMIFNVTDFVRVTAGAGLSRWQAYLATPEPFLLGSLEYNVTSLTGGTGVKIFVPSWNLSPNVGLNFSFIPGFGTGTFSFLGQSVTSHTQHAINLYANAGLEWITPFGLQFGAGINFPFFGPFTNLIRPYAHLGFMFEVNSAPAGEF